MRLHLPDYPSDIEVWPGIAVGLAGLCAVRRPQGAEQAAKLLTDIASLAQQAIGSGCGMYLWQCESP